MNYGFDFSPYQRPLCPNCERRAGSMGCSTWDHDYMCCSNACGVRLGHRIRHGFKPSLTCEKSYHIGRIVPDGAGGYGYSFPKGPTAQRIEIKRLRHLLKTAGVRRPKRKEP